MSDKIAELNERKVAILVEDLRLWVLSQTHLNSRTGDDFLRGFLRGCLYNLGETKRRIDLYYSQKNEIPSVLANRTVNKRLLDICQLGVIVDLPMLLPEKCARLHLSKYAQYNPNVYTYTEIMKVFFMLTEIQMLESRNARPCSVVHVVDLKGASLKHCLQFNFSLSRTIINASNCFVWLLSAVCSYMSVDIRYHLHSSMESLYKHIPQKYLPVEYGGRNGSIHKSIRRQVEKLIEFAAYFEDDAMYGVNESLRRRKV